MPAGFTPSAGDRHHVASPLGSWLLLALCGQACTGDAAPELARLLGCDIETAAQTAAALLTHPHPLVTAAAAAWHRPGFMTDALSGWQAGLPAAVETGELRGQAYLDDWAGRRTLGMIRRFPVKLTPDIAVLLATALATRVSWAQPFDLAPASDLGPASPWTAQLEPGAAHSVAAEPGPPAVHRGHAGRGCCRAHRDGSRRAARHFRRGRAGRPGRRCAGRRLRPRDRGAPPAARWPAARFSTFRWATRRSGR